jgi:hypothetical protein
MGFGLRYFWNRARAENHIALDTFPEDRKYITLTYPVARYKHLSLDSIIQEIATCNQFNGDRTFLVNIDHHTRKQQLGRMSNCEQACEQY